MVYFFLFGNILDLDLIPILYFLNMSISQQLPFIYLLYSIPGISSSPTKVLIVSVKENQPVLSNESTISCLEKQYEPLIVVKLTLDRNPPNYESGSLTPQHS